MFGKFWMPVGKLTAASVGIAVLAAVARPSFAQYNMECTRSPAHIVQQCMHAAHDKCYNLNDPKTMAYLRKECDELVRRCKQSLNSPSHLHGGAMAR